MTESHLLHLMRHGAPAVTGRMLGRTDDPATGAGIAQCMARAGDLKVTRILSSDLSRSHESAMAIAEPRGLAVEADARWCELDFGAWDGLSPADIDAAALARFYDDPDAAPPPGGERWSDLQARVGSALDALQPVPTLVLTHAGPIRAALTLLCGFDRRQVWAFDLPYAALMTVRIWEGSPRTVQIVGLAT